jgi:hypothetical protein
LIYVAFAALLAVVLGGGCYAAYRLGVQAGHEKEAGIMTPEEAGADEPGSDE